jgi:hypothetical protein
LHIEDLEKLLVGRVARGAGAVALAPPTPEPKDEKLKLSHRKFQRKLEAGSVSMKQLIYTLRITGSRSARLRPVSALAPPWLRPGSALAPPRLRQPI